MVDMDVPNLLNPKARFSEVVRLEVPTTSADKLALLGGLPGILSHMARDKARPDIKTFSQLLDVLSSTSEAESDLLASMKLHDVRPDVDLFNAIIRRRNLRKDYRAAKVFNHKKNKLNHAFIYIYIYIYPEACVLFAI